MGLKNAVLFSLLLATCFFISSRALGVAAVTVASESAADCARAEPVPAIKKTSTVKHYSFSKISTQIVKESFVLKSGIAATLIHSGCAHYVLQYEFLLDTDSHKVTDVNYWLRRANSLLVEIERASGSGNIPSIKMALAQAQKTRNYQYKAEIETIPHYEYTYVNASLVNRSQVLLTITYEVIL
jgi:hypothetical protein